MKNNFFQVGSFLLVTTFLAQSFLAADTVIPSLMGKYTTWDATSRKLPNPGQASVIFKAQAKNDVVIAFSPSASTQDPMYEIVLGGWANTQSVIRRKAQGKNEVEVKGSPCNATQAQTYWVVVDEANKTVSAGTGSTIGQNVIISYKDVNFIPNLQYFAFSSWDQPITFVAP